MMPFAPIAMSAPAGTKAVFKTIVGSKMSSMISAISSASAQYVPASAIINSTNVVTGPGSGVSTGKMVGLIPSVMSNLMMQKAITLQLLGRDTKRFFDSIAYGVVQAINTVVTQGTVIGGGPGTGVGKVTNLIPAGLKGIIQTQILSKLMMGSKSPAIASAIAFGICNHIMSAATVQITNVGAFAPPPLGPVPIPGAVGIARM